MSVSKSGRDKKKQMGQFMTPIELCQKIISDYKFKITDKVLEPSLGEGNFIVTIVDKFLDLYDGDIQNKIDMIFKNNIWGVELDPELYQKCLNNIKIKYGVLPKENNLFNNDFLLYQTPIEFDHIIGNPPFGGTIDPTKQNELDKKYGMRQGIKIKKETYSFFVVKCIEHLKSDGKLTFILSDTFLTIKTMTGMRKFLYLNGSNNIDSLSKFSEETNYSMVVLVHEKSKKSDHIVLNNSKIDYNNMILTDNFSWSIESDLSRYFRGPKLKDFLICSGGITTGNNELFIREIKDDKIIEKYKFEFYEDRITVDNEIDKARNNILSDAKIRDIRKQEESGETNRNVKITEVEPFEVELPNDDYCFYNKATNETIYTAPKNVIYWKDDGDAVLTYKKNGNWYLKGVGGKQYFKRKCITWQLISSRINARFLPKGYIMDNGSPIGVLLDGLHEDELFFILGWLLTDLATEIQKKVINHTKNIQNKDIERMPYPFWVNDDNKKRCVKLVKNAIISIKNGDKVDIKETLNNLFVFPLDL